MSAGMVVSSHGREVEVLVQSEEVELGSIIDIGGFYGIVAEMYYNEDDKIGSKQKLIARTQIFGKLSGGRLRRIKRPIEPYREVNLASDEALESMLKSKEQVSFGNVSGTKARAYLKADEYDRHIAILASTGSGKSYTAANLIKEFASIGLPVLVVDTHGEYPKLVGKLAEKAPIKTEVYTVKYGKQGYNQLKIPVSTLTANDFRHFSSINDNQTNALEVIINRIYSRLKDGEEYYSLDDIIKECNNAVENAKDGKDPEIHEETGKALKRKMMSLKSSFKDVFDVYGTDLNKMITPHQVTIIDASMAPQPVKQSVISYLSKKILQGRINHVNGVPEESIDNKLLFVIEEAHNYAGSNLAHSCKYQLQRIASEGRKFGIGLCVISQKPSKIDEEILSQCNTGVYMHITNPRDKDHIKRSFESINDAIISDLDSLDVGECIIAGAMLDIPFLVCNVDRIEVKDSSGLKFSFKKTSEARVGGFNYV